MPGIKLLTTKEDVLVEVMPIKPGGALSTDQEYDLLKMFEFAAAVSVTVLFSRGLWQIVEALVVGTALMVPHDSLTSQKSPAKEFTPPAQLL